jgi:phage/plasmid-like protein (TIGR03299 family)
MVSGSGVMPWHKIGTVVQGTLTTKEAIKAAGLDWQVEKRPIYFEKTVGKAKVMEKIEDKFSMVRTDTQENLGVVGGVYTPLQNRVAFSFIDGILGLKEATIETAGALGRGERIWVLSQLKGVISLKGNDLINKYLLCANAHDGSMRVTLALTTTRVVCNNTLRIAVKEASENGDIYRIRHSTKMEEKVDSARDALGLIQEQFRTFEEQAKRLTEVRVNTAKLDEFLDLMGFDLEAKEGRKKETVDEVKEAFVSSPGANLASAKGTLWGAVNAITYWADHERGTRLTDSFKSKDEARFNATQFGSGAAIKEKALKVALSMAKK